MISIRNYNKEDYGIVSEILIEAELFDPVWDSPENVNGMSEKDPESVLVAVKDDKVVGNLFIIYYGPKLQYLFRLADKKEFRKNGIASKLLEHAKNTPKKEMLPRSDYMLIQIIVNYLNFTASADSKYQKRAIFICGKN